MNSEFVVLSDIHGNYPALKEVVDDEGHNKEYMVLGDIHGLNAYPKKTLDMIEDISNLPLLVTIIRLSLNLVGVTVNSDKLSKFELHYTLSNLNTDDVEWMCLSF